MNRFTMIMALLLMMAMSLKAERVAPETARKVATTFLNNNGAKTAQLTDLSKAAGFENLYIFTTENSFVVMAADDCVQPILGYSLTGKFVVEGMPENLRWWLKGYDEQIADAVASKVEVTAEVTQQWKDLEAGIQRASKADVIVAPMVQTKWDQNKYYNRLCPSAAGGPDGHVYTGCVATAMAQVMKYWNHPTTGNGSHSYTHNTYGEQSVNFGENTYDWTNMPVALNNKSTEEQVNAVAKLMYHCGVSVDMNYGTGSSGASSYKVQDALINYFKYSTSSTFISRSMFTDAQWIAFLKSELDESRPLFYSGNNENSGHAFVCDGYRSDNKFHFNWGWSGSDGGGNDNGYWAIGALNPGSGGSGSGSGTYNQTNSVIAWVEPMSDFAAPSLAATEENGNILLTWNPVDGAVAYDVYKDNVKVATINTCEYTDEEADYGTNYMYYVRAIGASDKSNPSNLIRIMVKQHDRVVTNLALNLSKVDNSIHLTWDAPETQSASLYYGIGLIGSYYGDGNSTYWGQKYSPTKLSPFDGMVLNQVSLYARVAGSYTLFLYKDNTSNLLLEQQFTAQPGWNNISFEAIPIDCSSDLWVIFHTTANDPALFGPYYEDDFADSHYIFYDVDNLIPYSLSDEQISWPIKLNVTDSEFSYSIYRNNAEIETGLTSNSFTDNPTESGNYEYFVKTEANNWISVASTSVSIDFSTMHTVSEEVSINHDIVLSAANQYNITSTGKLTVNGTLSNSNASNLILENGAQLIHNSANVKATVKKDIEAINGNQGWSFIASPVTENIEPSTANGFLNGTAEVNDYDLYYYDEPTHYWRNYESHSDDFIIEHTTGYLYANNTATTLQFEGTLAPSNSTVSVSGLSHGAERLNGFNLVGNPFACNATIDKDCYVISGRQVILADNAPTLAPCEGVMVKADSDEYTVTFTKANAAKSSSKSKSLDLVVTRGGVSAGSTPATLDRARVRLGEGTNMEKFTLDGNESTQLSFWQDGQEYAVAYTDVQSELPLNFKAAENGTYSIGIETNSLDLDYLHLIDNLTGADVDLLATNGGDAMHCVSTYTFEAKTSDYASRFRLVFNASDALTGSASFAYVSNGEIVITADASDASLQVVDVMGRVIASYGGHTRCVPTSGMPSGVYVLRLIGIDSVRTQKIVIE